MNFNFLTPRFHLLLKFVLIALFCMLTQHAHSQWSRTNGPIGGSINDFVAVGNILFAGCYSGVWQSTDNGDNWIPKNDFPGSNSNRPGIISLATDSVYLYAGGTYDLFKAPVNGGAWTATSLGIGNITALEIMGGKIYAGGPGGVRMSSDSGLTWVPFVSGMTLMNTLSMATNGNYLYLGTTLGGLYRLANGDSTWVPLNAFTSNADVRALLIDSTLIYAGSQVKIKVSFDNGVSWASISNGLPVSFPVKSLGKFEGYVYASAYNGLYRTNNNGANWNSNSNPLGVTVSTFAVKDSMFFAGSEYAGVHRRQSGSNSWSRKWIGFNNGSISALATQGQRLFAASNVGIFNTDDEGVTWNGPSLGVNTYIINTIAANDSIVLAGTLQDGIFKSTNSGTSWSPLSIGIPTGSTSIQDIQFLDNFVFASALNYGMFRSSDMGINWDTINVGLTSTNNRRIFFIESIGSNLYISTPQNIFVSYDYGLSWNTMTNGLQFPSLVAPRITSIGNYLFAAISGKGVFRYLEGDTAWLPVDLGAWEIYTTHSSITHLGHYLFVDANNELIFSDDLGLTWNAVGSSLETNSVNSMVTIGQVGYATSGVRGVFKNSSLLTSMIEIPKEKPCILYPNPIFKNEYIVNLDCEVISEFKLAELLDLRGLVVRKLQFSSAENNIQFNLENVSPGFYFIRILNGKENRLFKLVVR